MSTPSSASLNAHRRRRELEELAGGAVVDVLVVGGGVSGAGVALDAATRGLSVALIEKGDLAHGTSRWSSKLVHGGLRYLAKGEVGIAHESAVERGVLMEHVAPHLLRALPMVTPVLAGRGRRYAPLAAAGLLAGDVLRSVAGTSAEVLPRPRWIGRGEALELFPGVRREGLHGGLLSFDGQLVDDARLVIGLARTAAAHGARVVTYCAARAIDAGGADAVDGRTGASLRVRARHVVNATGVWAGTLAPSVELAPSKGAHLVLSGARLGHPRAALLVAVPGTVSRFVFFLPQHDGRVYLGITDDPVDVVTDTPRADAGDISFLLETASRALAIPLTEDDVIGSYAGLRPLVAGGGGASADLSREHRVLERDGVLTLVGGKLTTYRKMAEDAVDRLAARGGVCAGPCRTRRTALVGARGPTAGASAHLVGRYGSDAPRIAQLAAEEPRLARPLVEGLPYLAAELAWSLRHEGALEVSDLLDRRTRIGLVASDRAEAAPVAAELLAEHLPPGSRAPA